MEVIQRLIDKRGPWPPKPYESPRPRTTESGATDSDATRSKEKKKTQDRQFTAVASTTGGPDDTVSGPNYPTTVRVDLGVRGRIGKKLRWPLPLPTDSPITDQPNHCNPPVYKTRMPKAKPLELTNGLRWLWMASIASATHW